MSSIHAAQNARKTRVRVGATIAAVLGVALSSFVGGTAIASDTDFKDVPQGDKFKTEITWLADQQVTTGYANGTFKPKDSVSREAFAAFLYRLAGKPSVKTPSKSPFKDVGTKAQFYKEIVWLSNEKITTGWSDGTFRPKDKISREAIAAFLYRFEDVSSFKAPSKSPFKDMKPSSKFFKEVTWLSRSGMTTGYADGTFRPKANVSREAIAAFLYRGNTVARGDADHKVGTDIKPGIYTAVISGERFNSTCYYERRSDNTNDLSAIHANRLTFGGRVTVEIKSTDKYFHTRGCSGWTPLREVSPNATSFKDGYHAVGYHMQAGTYRASGKESLCYWSPVSDFTGDTSAIILTDKTKEEIRLTEGQGISTRGCGTWTRIGN